MQTSYFIKHPLRYVYTSSAVQFILQILLTFILIRKLDHSDFADYNYAALIPGIAAIITNSAFDSLVNRELGKLNEKTGFYNLSIKIKPIIYASIAFPAWIIFAKNNQFFLFLFVSLLSLFVEHHDILFRFKSNYNAFKIRTIINLIFSPIKIIFSINGYIHSLIIILAIEQLLIIFFNKKILLEIEFDLINKNWGSVSKNDLFKSFLGGACIFIFFKIDQIILYQISDKKLFSFYSAASRINDMHNSFTGIFARHIIPKIYSNEIKYKSGLLKLWIINTIGIFITIIGSSIIFIFAAPNYTPALNILPPLLISSYFLIFGQIRGIFFVKNGKFMADTINALLGILIMLAIIYGTDMPVGMKFSISYLIAFLTTGMVTTIIYSTGRNFLKEIGFMKNGR